MDTDPRTIEETRRATALAEATRLARPDETPATTTLRAREFYRFLAAPGDTGDRTTLTGGIDQ